MYNSFTFILASTNKMYTHTNIHYKKQLQQEFSLRWAESGHLMLVELLTGMSKQSNDDRNLDLPPSRNRTARKKIKPTREKGNFNYNTILLKLGNG